jgi:hypothetical protein
LADGAEAQGPTAKKVFEKNFFYERGALLADGAEAQGPTAKFVF